MSDTSTNATADTPDVSETDLATMKLGELREHARARGIAGADDLRKPELLAKVKDHHYAQAHGGQHRPDTPGAGAGDVWVEPSATPSRVDADAGPAEDNHAGSLVHAAVRLPWSVATGSLRLVGAAVNAGAQAVRGVVHRTGRG